MDIPSKQWRLTSSRVEPAWAVPTLAEDVRAGLLAPPRTLPPKYFYDDYGSRLFEAICHAPEYYPARTEQSLLVRHAGEIAGCLTPAHVIELGSGSARKTCHLFDACERLQASCTYWPFDVSEQMMLDSALDLITRYPWLQVHALAGDYTGGLANLPVTDDGRRLILFLGGTIGNFEPAEAAALMSDVRRLMRPGDALLLGLDRVKDRARMESAYDDSDGLTAEFNRNVLNVLNRELGADFPVAAYRHRAVFNAADSRVEMQLVAERGHRVHMTAIGEAVDIAAGEAIRTEVSRKFTPESIDALLAEGGLAPARHFEAANGDYSLVLAGIADQSCGGEAG